MWGWPVLVPFTSLPRAWVPSLLWPWGCRHHSYLHSCSAPLPSSPARLPSGRSLPKTLRKRNLRMISGPFPRSQPVWVVRALPLFPEALSPSQLFLHCQVYKREVSKLCRVSQCSFCPEKSVARAEHVAWLGTSGLWSSDTAALYSLSFCFGAGIAVFLDPPDIAKTSSTWRCRTGLLACVAEASCLKLRRHMLGALVCCRGWWRGWCVLFWLHLDRFIALHAVCAWGCVEIQD